MKVKQSLFILLCFLFISCEKFDWFKKDITVFGRVVESRSRKPIPNVIIRTNRRDFCGFGCTYYHKTDSSGSDQNGYFSFKASTPGLLLSFAKKNYSGIYPSEGLLNRMTEGGDNDFGDVVLTPQAQLEITFTNSQVFYIATDTLKGKIFSCGSLLNDINNLVRLNRIKKITHTYTVEGDCPISIELESVKNGKSVKINRTLSIQTGQKISLDIDW